MRKFVLVLLASLSLMLGLVGSASAAPTIEHWPTNPKACVGHSSTSANFVYQEADSAKHRDEQARGLDFEGNVDPDGERGRKDDIQDIRNGPQCDTE